ncbi:MAG TPA: hypothetical protein PLO41_20625, partial [Rubrivivax sp.]|nr:hypothetical protein [Rubrivivax sp.]
GLLSQSGLIALALLGAPAAEVGAFAAAASTVGLVVVCASATNRAYGRRLSLLLERRDHAGLQRLRRRRLGWLLPSVLAFLLACTLYGRELLLLFGRDFAAHGTQALLLLAAGASLAVLLALAPTCLKYLRRTRTMFTAVAGGVLLQSLSLALLVPRFGATGAAAAYLLSIGSLYLCFGWLAHRALVALREA